MFTPVSWIIFARPWFLRLLVPLLPCKLLLKMMLEDSRICMQILLPGSDELVKIELILLRSISDGQFHGQFQQSLSDSHGQYQQRLSGLPSS